MAQRRQEDVARGAGLIARPGLRFDKVALAFIARLQEALSDCVPADKTLVVTCTAPIRKDSKTSSELSEVLRRKLARGSARLDFKATINGNQIRARLVKRAPTHADKLVGYIHNPDVDPKSLMSP